MMSAKSSIASTFVASLIYGAVGLGVGIFVARMLGPEGKGAYTLVQLLAATAASLSLCNIGESSIYFYNRLKVPLGTIVVTGTVFLSTLAAWFAMILGGLYAVQCLPWPELHNPQYLAFVLLLMPTILFRLFFMDLLRATGKFVPYNLSIVGQIVMYGAVVVPLLGIFHAGVPGALISTFLSFLLTTFFAAIWLWRTTEIRLRWDFGYLKKSFAYGIKGHLGGVFHKVESRLDQFFITPYCGTAALGLYSVSVMLAEAVFRIPDSIGIVALPLIAQADRDQSALWIAKAFRLTTAVAIVVLGGLACIAEHVVVTLYGAAFHPATYPLLLLLPGSLFMCWSKILSKYFSGIGRPGISSLTTLVSLASTLVLCLVLIPRYCLTGAAIASTASYGLRAVLDVWVFTRLGKCGLGDLLIPRLAEFRELLNLFTHMRRRFSGKDR